MELAAGPGGNASHNLMTLSANARVRACSAKALGFTTRFKARTGAQGELVIHKEFKRGRWLRRKICSRGLRAAWLNLQSEICNLQSAIRNLNRQSAISIRNRQSKNRQPPFINPQSLRFLHPERKIHEGAFAFDEENRGGAGLELAGEDLQVVGASDDLAVQRVDH